MMRALSLALSMCVLSGCSLMNSVTEDREQEPQQITMKFEHVENVQLITGDKNVSLHGTHQTSSTLQVTGDHAQDTGGGSLISMIASKAMDAIGWLWPR